MVSIFLVACSFFRGGYNINVYMTSEKGYGVIIHEFPVQQDIGNVNHDSEKDKNLYIRPIISTDRASYTSLGEFVGYRNKTIPDEITIRYQYANLSECSRVSKRKPLMMKNGKEVVLEDTTYTDKLNCKKWEPFGKILIETIDLNHIKNSKEIKQMGKTSTQGAGHYRARIIFRFYDDDIKVSVNGYTTNRWK